MVALLSLALTKLKMRRRALGASTRIIVALISRSFKRISRV